MCAPRLGLAQKSVEPGLLVKAEKHRTADEEIPERPVKRLKTGSESDGTDETFCETIEVLNGVPVLCVKLHAVDAEKEPCGALDLNTEFHGGCETMEDEKGEEKGENLAGMIDLTILILAFIFPTPHSQPPLCPLRAFILRTLARSAVPRPVFDLALFLLIRLSLSPASKRTPQTLCARRMWLASLIVASQISLDRAAPLSHWSASVSGLPLPILRSIHLDFLLAIEHKCNPSDSYPRFLEGLENWAGWLTETRQVARMCNAVSAAQKLGICESIRKGLERCRTELWALVERRESEA